MRENEKAGTVLMREEFESFLHNIPFDALTHHFWRKQSVRLLAHDAALRAEVEDVRMAYRDVVDQLDEKQNRPCEQVIARDLAEAEVERMRNTPDWRDGKDFNALKARVKELEKALRPLYDECVIIRTHPERKLKPHPDTMEDARKALEEG